MTTAIGYTRVSTADQARSGLGLAAQERLIRQACKARGWALESVYSDALGGTHRTRPELTKALAQVQAINDSALVVAKLDRLTRSFTHLGEIIELSESGSWALVALDLGLDTSTETGRLVVRIMGSIAEWERGRIRERISEAMRAKIASGWTPGGAAIPAEIVSKIRQLRSEGKTLQAIADELRDVPTARGGSWRPSTVKSVLDRA